MAHLPPDLPPEIFRPLIPLGNLAESEGFELGQVTFRFSKLLMHKVVDVPC
jgi:hypothetical protein